MKAPSLCAARYRALCISEQGASRYGSSVLRVTGEIGALCTRVPELLPTGGLGFCALVGSWLCASGYQSSVHQVNWCSVHEGAGALCTGMP